MVIIYILSAASEIDLQRIFSEKGLDHLFTGIYGGPRTKIEIFSDILACHQNSKPIFFGDAKADSLVAEKYNVDRLIDTSRCFFESDTLD